MSHWLTVASSLFVAAAIGLAAVGWGGLILRRFVWEATGRLERLLWRLGVGLTALAVSWTLAGFAGLFLSSFFFITVAVGLLFGLLAWRQARNAERVAPSAPDHDPGPSVRRWPWPPTPAGRLAWVSLLVASVTLILVVAWGGTLPEIFYDALYYHLGLPAQYLLQARIEGVDSAVHSAFPAYVDVLFAGAMALGGVGAAKALNLFFWLLAGAASAALYRQLHGRWDLGAWAAGLLAVAAPGVLVMATMCSVDVALLALGALTMQALLRAGPESGGRRWLVLAGVAAGLAIGSKYTGLYLLLAAVVLHGVRRRSRGALLDVALLSGVALAVAAPWYLRNLIRFGDPIYPAASGWLEGSGGGAWALARIGRDLPDFGWGPSAAWELARALIATPERLGAGAQLGGLLLAAPLVLLVGAWRRPDLRPVVAALVAFVVAWSLAAPGGRYLYPILPLLAAATVAAVIALVGERRGSIGAALLIAAFALVNTTSAGRILAQLYGANAWRLHGGAISRADYLRAALPYFAASEWLRANSEPEEGVLFVGETRLLYVDRPVRFSSAYDRAELALWLERFALPAELNAHLEGLGVRFVLVNRGELGRLQRAYGHLRLGAQHRGRVRAWLETCRLVFDDGGVQICEVASAAYE